MQLFTIRKCFLIGFLFTCFLLAFAGYLQISKGLLPCPLCQLQRITFGIIALIFLFAAIHNPKVTGIKIYSYVLILFSVFGSALAARHIWIQNSPSEISTRCGVGIDYIFSHFPLLESLKIILHGTGDCAEVQWHFLGLSIPEWAFVSFALTGFVAFTQIIRIVMRKKK